MQSTPSRMTLLVLGVAIGGLARWCAYLWSGQ